MFEGRRPLYGSFSMPPDMSITTAGGIADLVPLDGLPKSMARTFADGRSAFVVNRHDEPPGARLLRSAGAVRGRARPAPGGHRHGGVACSARPSSARSGCSPTPRHLVGRAGLDRPSDRWQALLTALRASAPELLDPAVAHGLLDLAVHWLSPAGGARRSSSTSTASSGRRWTWPRSSTHRPLDQEPPALPGAVRLAAAARSGHVGHRRREHRVPRRRSPLERRGRAQRRQPPRHAPPLGPALQLRPPRRRRSPSSATTAR